MGKLLLDEPPLQIQSSLAVAIGLNEAIFLQQLHYWLERSKNQHDGRRWVYNTFEEWQEKFPFWSLRTMERIVARLRNDLHVVTVRKFKQKDWDRRNWYAIDYEVFARLEAEADARQIGGQVASVEPAKMADSRTRQIDGTESAGMAESLKTEISSEITKENTRTGVCADSASPQSLGEDSERVAQEAPLSACSSSDVECDLPPSDSFASVGNILARIGTGSEFDAEDSRKKALAARPAAKRRSMRPVETLIVIPEDVANKISPDDRRALSTGLTLDRDEFPLRVEAWRISRRQKGRDKFVTRGEMMEDLRAYLINCTTGKRRMG